MNLQKIKTILLRIVGYKITAFIHGIRFFYLVKKKTKMDPESQLLGRFLKKGDIAVDVGANGADWTYRLSKVVGDSGHIYAFEADPYYSLATFHALKILKTNNVDLFSIGLSDKKEKMFLRVTEEDGSRHNGRAFIDKNANQSENGLESIQLESLDSFLEKNPNLSKTKLIKCDVEGYELFVFKGAETIIKSAKPFIILEVGHFERQGYNGNTLYEFFKKYDYKAFALTSLSTLEETDSNLNNSQSITVNRVLIPTESLKIFKDIIK